MVGVVGWATHLGSLVGGKLADVLAIASETGDPFEHLIGAREHLVQLVIVHGVRRYGDEMLMQDLQPGPAPHPLSTLNDLPFNTAVEPLAVTVYLIP